MARSTITEESANANWLRSTTTSVWARIARVSAGRLMPCVDRSSSPQQRNVATVSSKSTMAESYTNRLVGRKGGLNI
jgi:hypothetical protein